VKSGPTFPDWFIFDFFIFLRMDLANNFLSSLMPKEESYRQNHNAFNRPIKQEIEEEEKLVPLHLRPRKLNFWDQKPKNYDHLTAEQAKATGMYLLPCHLLKGTGSFAGVSGFGLLESSMPFHIMENLGRNTKRLYIGSLPSDLEDQEVIDFFNQEYENKGLDKSPGNPVLAAMVTNEKHSALIEFRSKDETTTALELDGIEFKGSVLKIRRPKDYVAGEEDPHYVPGI
jgi:splicing factor U2AF subunit